MTDGDALLRAILEAPDDDAPRLVYADWLDEHGEPERAEFIRVQCALARSEVHFLEDPIAYQHSTTNGGPDTVRAVFVGPTWRPDAGNRFAIATRGKVVAVLLNSVDYRPDLHGRLEVTGQIIETPHEWGESLKLQARSAGLLMSPLKPNGQFSDRQTNHTRWGPPFTVRDGWQHHYTFRRGFVESITCPADDCLAHLDQILTRHPIREVTLTTRPDVQAGPVLCRLLPDPRNNGHDYHASAFVHWGHREPMPVHARQWLPDADVTAANAADVVGALWERLGREVQFLIDTHAYLGGEGGWWPGIKFVVRDGAPWAAAGTRRLLGRAPDLYHQAGDHRRFTIDFRRMLPEGEQIVSSDLRIGSNRIPDAVVRASAVRNGQQVVFDIGHQMPVGTYEIHCSVVDRRGDVYTQDAYLHVQPAPVETV